MLDGWGHRNDTRDNSVLDAQTPCFDSLWKTYPTILLHASGEYVCLPDGQIGNSEIGHMTIGAGTSMPTDLVRVTKDAINGNLNTMKHLCNYGITV